MSFRQHVRSSGSLIALVLCLAAEPVLATAPLELDFGPVAGERVGVTVVSRTSDAVDWIVAPTGESVNRAQERSRDAVTIDSVVGAKLKLALPTSAPFAHIAFLTEAGMEDASQLSFSIDGQTQTLGWLAFDPPHEPRTAPRPEMRLLSSTVPTAGSRTVIEWTNAADPVHLAWVRLIPLTEAKITAAPLHQLMRRAGDTVEMEPLAPLLAELRAGAVPATGERFVVEFWLDTMAKADRYFEEYRGWSASDEKSGLSMFGRYSQAIMWLDGLIADPMFRSTPLYARALLQRARLQHWMWVEGSDTGEMHTAAVRDWTTLAAMNVRPDLTPIYLGQAVAHASPCDNRASPAAAPMWAVRQRDALCRLEELVGWWTSERQAENGELGGKWGDDVEMMRWWQIPLLSGSRPVWEGWSRLADGVWNSNLIADGYHRRISDVEHAAEPIADTLLIYALADDRSRVARLQPSTRQFIETWTRTVGPGERRFRSAWFGSEGVDERPPRDRDVQMNARAAKSVRFHVNATEDAAASEALVDWSRMWARATLSTAKGKPAGVAPPSIRFADGAINGDEPTWYQANMYWDYFDWDGDAKIYDQILFASSLSDDPVLDKALTAGFDLVARYQAKGDGDLTIGSPDWAAQRLLASDSFHAVWGQWRLSTGDRRYDAALSKISPSRYLRFRLTGDDSVLAAAGQGIIDKLSVNWPMLTSEVLFTDRVYASGRGNAVDYGDMLGMMTGAMSTDSPHYHVTWHDRRGELAYLVRDASRDGLRFDMVAFDPDTKSTAKFWQLQRGAYCVATIAPSGDTASRALTIEHHGDRFDFALALPGLYRVTVARAPKRGCARN